MCVEGMWSTTARLLRCQSRRTKRKMCKHAHWQQTRVGHDDKRQPRGRDSPFLSLRHLHSSSRVLCWGCSPSARTPPSQHVRSCPEHDVLLRGSSSSAFARLMSGGGIRWYLEREARATLYCVCRPARCEGRPHGEVHAWFPRSRIRHSK